MRDPFRAERRAIRAIDRDIAREQKHAEPILRRLVKEGRYEAAASFRDELHRRFDKLLYLRQVARKWMPPFCTIENNLRFLHPVTPENVHLLRA